MPGTVTIGTNQWSVSVASTPIECSQGLSGLAGIPAGTGMLFDLGADVVMDVTTEQMLFPIDIIWIHSTEGVKEIARNVSPGHIVTPSSGCRYFLEVNAGEAEDVEVGDSVTLDITPSMMETIIGAAAPLLVIGMLGSIMKGSLMTQKALRAGDKVEIITGPHVMKVATIKEVLRGRRGDVYILDIPGVRYPQIYTEREVRALGGQRGHPLSEEERIERHRKLYGTPRVPPRGTGLLGQSSLKKAKEIAEDIEELVEDIFFQKERSKCLFCQRIDTIIKPDELSLVQQRNLEKAQNVARELTGKRTPVKVASFDEANILGATDGRTVYITPQRLNSWPRTLNTVAHEAAHIVTGEDDYSPVFQSKVKDLTAQTLKFLQLKPRDKEQLVREYGVWAAGLAEKMVPPGDTARARALASRLVRELMIE